MSHWGFGQLLSQVPTACDAAIAEHDGQDERFGNSYAAALSHCSASGARSVATLSVVLSRARYMTASVANHTRLALSGCTLNLCQSTSLQSHENCSADNV